MAAANVRSEITKSLNDAISDEKSVKEIIADVKEIVIKTGVSEHDVVVLVRSSPCLSVQKALQWSRVWFKKKFLKEE